MLNNLFNKKKHAQKPKGAQAPQGTAEPVTIQQITPHSEHVNPSNPLLAIINSLEQYFWGGDKTNEVIVEAEQTVDITDPINLHYDHESATGTKIKFSVQAGNTVKKNAKATLNARSALNSDTKKEPEE